MEIPYGFCHCGCGRETTMALHTYSKFGVKQGEPNKFLIGHGYGYRRGSHNPNWKGGKISSSANGKYFQILIEGEGKYILEHRLIAEKALGKPLPPGVQVHHINGNSFLNCKSNLVICQDASYHTILHRRREAFDACGHAHWRRCSVCDVYDEPRNMKAMSDERMRHHTCRLKTIRAEKV